MASGTAPDDVVVNAAAVAAPTQGAESSGDIEQENAPLPGGRPAPIGVPAGAELAAGDGEPEQWADGQREVSLSMESLSVHLEELRDIQIPDIINFNEWQTWRAGPGRRPHKDTDGYSTSGADESELWKQQFVAANARPTNPNQYHGTKSTFVVLPWYWLVLVR